MGETTSETNLAKSLDFQEVVSHTELEEVIALHRLSYETPFNAFYVLERGETGPEEHTQRLIKEHEENPASRWFKVVDSLTGKTIAAAQWHVRIEGQNPYEKGQPPAQNVTWWSEGEPRKFAELLYERWSDVRPVALKKPHLWLNACFVHPEHRRMGAGSMLLQWGLDTADRLGLDMFIEAVDDGKPLYAKYGCLLLGTVYLRSEVQESSVRWKELEAELRTPLHYHLMWRPAGGLGGALSGSDA